MEKTIVLLRPPLVIQKWENASTICPPLGLAYVAAAIRNAGFNLRCVDALGEAPFQRIILENPNFLVYGLSTREIVERVGKCDILGVSLMFSHDWPVAKSVIQALRQANPQATIICGGEHINAIPEFCLQDCPEIDICVLGEGEETIVDLLKTLHEGCRLEKVPGIVFRSNDGSCVRTPARARIRKLEEIAWPAWDLFPLENYLANGLGYGVNPGRTVPLLVSRGCPFECTFCSSPQMWTTRYQVRSTDDVIGEMQFYIDRYQAQNFDFYDLTAIIRKDWIMEFCEKAIAKKWNFTWQMPQGTRSEALDGEVLHLMYLSGQRNITYAPESGSPTTLRLIKKKVKLDRLKASIRAALKEGMNVKLNMIMGFPHDTKKEIFESFRFLVELAVLGVHDVYIACFSPYPGSELFDQLVKSGRIKALDNDYFLTLTNISDLLYSYSYSPHITHRQLAVYRLGGMFMFYAISYITHPTRFFKLIFNVLTGRQESRLDMALSHLIDRLWTKKISLEDVERRYKQTRAVVN
ncbi:MAG: cobalamin B12-binding domain-containing protein [Deltaproteobacteria bacterium]|nr:cobalamin B12-binding domain-containing protein [Deltaproteobacteria bacterium]